MRAAVDTGEPYFSASKAAICLLLCFASLARCSETHACPQPAVPFAASYVNTTKVSDHSDWSVRYSCDDGFDLFGDADNECLGGKWIRRPPECLFDVAKLKPAAASSQANGGEARNRFHESPFWSKNFSTRFYP
jgi:hypothetical protein